jgi:hypothetical protein
LLFAFAHLLRLVAEQGVGAWLVGVAIKFLGINIKRSRQLTGLFWIKPVQFFAPAKNSFSGHS